MVRSSFIFFAAILLYGCASPPPPRDPLPELTSPSADPVVVLYKGVPIPWSEVSEKMLKLNQRRSVDLYLRWRVVADAIDELKVEPSSSELALRAAKIMEEERTLLGKADFAKRLQKLGLNEDLYVRKILKSPLLKDTLQKEMIVRYTAWIRGWIECDWFSFDPRKQAETFLQKDPEKKSLQNSLVLCKNTAPTRLSKEGSDVVFSTPEGGRTAPLRGTDGRFHVVSIRKTYPARKASWPKVSIQPTSTKPFKRKNCAAFQK